MKTTQIFTVFTIAVVLGGCIDDGCSVEPRQEIKQADVPEQAIVPDKPYVNPVLIYGTDIWNFQSANLRTQPADTELLLKFTSTSSRKEFSREAILGFYRATSFQKRLAGIKKVNDSTYLMSYVTRKFGTRGQVTIRVVIERDSAKVRITKELMREVRGWR